MDNSARQVRWRFLALAAVLVAAPSRVAAVTVAQAAAEIKSLPAADADPAKSLAYNVLRYMAGAIRSVDRQARPVARDPHEWSGAKVVAAGNFNGCVEAAKAFKTLYDAAGPAKKSVYVGGTMKGRDGGHAVVEVAGRDGRFLVDASLFERVALDVQEAEAARPPGKIVQTGREDLLVFRKDGRWRISRWQYTHLYHEDRRLGPDLEFDGFDGARRWLSAHAAALRDFSELEKAGLVKRESAGTFVGPQGELEYVYAKTEGRPFDGTDAQRVRAGQRALEDRVKYGR